VPRRNLSRLLLFGLDKLTAVTQTIAWLAIFFRASPAASSAYLTASEIFPKTRALAIACFLRAAYGTRRQHRSVRVRSADRDRLAWRVGFGCISAALLLLIAAIVELKFGVDAEGKSLESIADPLSQ
jgi:hypothetical protein